MRSGARGLSLATVVLVMGCGGQDMAAPQHDQKEDVPYAFTATVPASTRQGAAQTMPATSDVIGEPRAVQTALANAGFYAGPIDGKIGPMTRQAIQNFQQAHNLKVDGVVGIETWRALKTFLTNDYRINPKF